MKRNWLNTENVGPETSFPQTSFSKKMKNQVTFCPSSVSLSCRCWSLGEKCTTAVQLLPCDSQWTRHFRRFSLLYFLRWKIKVLGILGACPWSPKQGHWAELGLESKTAWSLVFVVLLLLHTVIPPPSLPHWSFPLCLLGGVGVFSQPTSSKLFPKAAC